MNETQQGRTDSSLVGPLVGFALGAVVGGVLALLLAPASGEHTRRRLGDAARRVGRQARQSFEDTRDAATGLGVDVKSAIDAGREAFRHDGSAPEPRLAARMANVVSAPPARTP